MLNAQCTTHKAVAVLLAMSDPSLSSADKPRDIHERLLEFACDIVRTAQFLHQRGPIARALSYQVLSAGTSGGANAAEADSASSRNDFIAKISIALKEAKETRFRLRVCRRSGLLDESFDALVEESDHRAPIVCRYFSTSALWSPRYAFAQRRRVSRSAFDRTDPPRMTSYCATTP